MEYERLTPDQQAAVDEVVRQQEEAREAVEREAGEQILDLLDRGARGRSSEIEAVLSEPGAASGEDDSTSDDEDLFARLGVPVRNDQED